MRPTINVNLAGLQFTFNDDAYQLMNEYLTSLSQAFRTQGLDTEELAADIESRCAEILAEEHDRFTYIVTGSDVAALIDRMGRPEEIVDVEIESAPGYERVSVEEESPSAQTPPQFHSAPQPVHKRLYRIVRGAEIGGVCGGVAAYFGLDPTYVRLATVALAFLSCSTVGIIYLIMWLVIPAARTPLQEMELVGESPTLNNIGARVKNFFSDSDQTVTDAPYENLTTPRAVRHTSRFLSILCKFCLIAIGLICIFSLIVCLGVFISELSDAIYPFYYNENPFSAVRYTRLATTGFTTIALGIPLCIVICMVARSLFTPRRKFTISRPLRKTLLVAWCLSLALAFIFSIIANRLEFLNNIW